MVTNAELILRALNEAGRPLSDKELLVLSGVSPIAQVNQICRRLRDQGLLTRTDDADGILVNTVVVGAQFTPRAAASSEQQTAEAEMLAALYQRWGVHLQPERLTSPDGVRIHVDGVAEDRSVLVECWAHQGTAKVAQKWKLVNDATKLQWAAGWLAPSPQRLVLCVSDEAAVAHLRGRSWQAAAIAALGVDIVVVDLAPATRSAVAGAQARQGRVEAYVRADALDLGADDLL